MRGTTAFLRFRFGVVFLLLALTPQLPAAPRTPWTTSRVTGSPNPPALLNVERVFPQLEFTKPVDFMRQPGSDRWVVLEEGGKLVSFQIGRAHV